MKSPNETPGAVFAVQDLRDNSGVVVAVAGSGGSISFSSLLSCNASFVIEPTWASDWDIVTNFSSAFRGGQQFVFSSNELLAVVGWVQGTTGKELGIVNVLKGDMQGTLDQGLVCGSEINGRFFGVSSSRFPTMQFFTQPQRGNNTVSYNTAIQIGDSSTFFSTACGKLLGLNESVVGPGFFSTLQSDYDDNNHPRNQSLLLLLIVFDEFQQFAEFGISGYSYFLKTSMMPNSTDLSLTLILSTDRSRGLFQMMRLKVGDMQNQKAHPNIALSKTWGSTISGSAGYSAVLSPNIVENARNDGLYYGLVQYPANGCGFVVMDSKMPSSGPTISFRADAVTSSACMFQPGIPCPPQDSIPCHCWDKIVQGYATASCAAG